MTVSSLLGKRLKLLRTWMSYLSQHLWCSDQCSLCKEEPWAQKCLLTSTAPPQAQGSQAFRSWWAEIPYKLLSLLAPPEGQKGHSSAVASIQLPSVAVPIGETSEMKGRVGVIWGWWDYLEEDKDTSTRTGNPSHFQAIGSLSLFTNYYAMLQKKKLY